MNNVSLVGRLIKDPELRYVGEKNSAVTNFVIAVDRDYKTLQGERESDFINIEAWGKQAEIICEYMTKGRLIGIEGKIKVDKYKNESGENRYITKVRATSFKFLDYKNKSLDALAVQENECTYYDSTMVFEEVNLRDEIYSGELPF